MIDVPIAEAHNRLSALLRKIQKNPVTLTRRGKPVGVLLSPEEYERLRQFEAYSQVVRVSQSLRESGVTAAEVYRASHDELENKS
ncbi:MAG: type II toxin-antitoxin system Phd/YefM family antitoxin [Chloroflexota bacterium]